MNGSDKFSDVEELQRAQDAVLVGWDSSARAAVVPYRATVLSFTQGSSLASSMARTAPDSRMAVATEASCWERRMPRSSAGKR